MNPSTAKHSGFNSRAIALCFLAAGLCSLLAGCASTGLSTGLPGGTTPVTATAHFSGNVHGGQQPISGATVQLYTVGTTGLKSASTPLGASATTNSNGVFLIDAGSYSCTNATQVYIVASGGSSGGGLNSAISVVAALGACTSLSQSTFIQMNEVTTIAAAYAFAPFAADLTHIGASGSNPTGLVGAFANAATLASTSTGLAPGNGLAAGVTVPVAEIYSLADIIASCINTSSSSSGPCAGLTSATGATDTFDQALAIAKNPGSSAITALYTYAGSTAPFQPSLSSAPNDFSIAVTSTVNGGLATPYGIAIDASGDAWVTNASGTAVTEISASGALVTTAAASGLAGAKGIAIDRSGNVWVANTAGNSVVEFTLTAGAVTGTHSFTAGAITAPTAIALDSAANAFITNYNGNSVTGLNSVGAALANSPFTGSGGITVPQGIALDASGNVYVTSGSGSIVKLTNAGAYNSTLSDGTLQGPMAVAVDTSGRLLATGFAPGTTVTGALSQFSSAGTAVATSPATSSLTVPSAVATDGASIWLANMTSSSGLTQYGYGATSATSPGTGFGSLNAPAGVAIDATGSVWTTNSGSNTVSKFIGLAVPVATPLAANVGP